jgi:hypothetical protein
MTKSRQTLDLYTRCPLEQWASSGEKKSDDHDDKTLSLLTLHSKSYRKRKEDCTFLLIHMTVVIFNLRYSSACFNSILLVRLFVDYWPTPCYIQFGQSLLLFLMLYHIQRRSFLAWLLRVHYYIYICSSFVRLDDRMSKWCHTWNISMCRMKKNTTLRLKSLLLFNILSYTVAEKGKNDEYVECKNIK